PAIADLATGNRAACIMTALGSKECPAQTRVLIPALVTSAAAAVQTDIEAAPVVDRRDHRGRRLGVGTSGKVRGRRRSGEAHCNQTNHAHQKLLHGISPALRPFVDREAFKMRPPRRSNWRRIYAIQMEKPSPKCHTRRRSVVRTS